MSARDPHRTCPLCGLRHRESESRTCPPGCPLRRTCGLLRCPRCGYEVPAPGVLTRALARWLGRAEERP